MQLSCFQIAHTLIQYISSVYRKEAALDAAKEPILSSYLYASIMTHKTLEQALAFVLANRMASQTMLATQLYELFYTIIANHQHVRKGAVMDLKAFRDRVGDAIIIKLQKKLCCMYIVYQLFVFRYLLFQVGNVHLMNLL